MNGVADFEKWAHEHHHRLHRLDFVDTAMEAFFNDLCNDGVGSWEGRDTLFGWILLKTHLDTSGRLVLSGSRRAFRGWKWKVPLHSRCPVPEEVVWMVGLFFLGQGWVDAAAALALQGDGYLRPSEVIELESSQILSPSPPLGKQYADQWGLVLAPQCSGTTTKTGQTDDTIMIGVPNRSWVMSVVQSLHSKRITGPLFPRFSLAKYELYFRKAVKCLGLTALGLTPHVVRHSGPSADLLMRVRTLDVVKKRGRWACDKSAARYGKEARLLQRAARLSASRQLRARKATFDFPRALIKALVSYVP